LCGVGGVSGVGGWLRGKLVLIEEGKKRIEEDDGRRWWKERIEKVIKYWVVIDWIW
jgi:hypothetical protein